MIGRTTTMKPHRLTVWCAISSCGIIGAFFFEQNVTAARYQEMLEDEFFPVAQGMDSVDNWWFMQDGLGWLSLITYVTSEGCINMKLCNKMVL